MLRADFIALCLVERVSLPSEVLHCGNRNIRPFWLMWPWPWPDDFHCWDVQIWASYVKAFESYRLTDIQKDRQVTRRHFRSRDKDDSRTIRSAILENPMLHASLMALSFIEPELWAIEVYIARTGIWAFSATVTLTFTHDDLHIRTWPVLLGDTRDVQIWTSNVKAFESYRLTDRQTDTQTYRQTESTEIIKHATSRVLKNRLSLYQQFPPESKNTCTLLQVTSLHCIFTFQPSTNFRDRSIFAANLFRKLCTRFHQNRRSLIEDVTTTFWSFSGAV